MFISLDSDKSHNCKAAKSKIQKSDQIEYPNKIFTFLRLKSANKLICTQLET